MTRDKKDFVFTASNETKSLRFDGKEALWPLGTITPSIKLEVKTMTEENIIADAPRVIWEPPAVECPKHGVHTNTIHSTIPGHEGRWCQICWLDLLGPPLPVVRNERYK